VIGIPDNVRLNLACGCGEIGDNPRNDPDQSAAAATYE
jgi:hypothetical protein